MGTHEGDTRDQPHHHQGAIMTRIFNRNAAIATLLAAALLTGCATVELSTNATGDDGSYTSRDDILKAMAKDSEGA